MLIGLAILRSRVSHSRAPVVVLARVLWGRALVGWGLSNLVEGLVDHRILGIHHVRGGPRQLWWDLAFLAVGAALVADGSLLQRRSTPPPKR